MRTRQRVVVDTNVLVSRLLAAESIPGLAVREARRRGRLLVSDATMYELAEVLSREKFDRYVSLEQRKQFLRQLGRIAELVPIIQVIRECRDPKDDKFLEVALNGRADVIITGDVDLLALHPWRGIAIVSPRNY
ncbi:MAG: putative toxin-antitoxin system toxin component, PIN family [Candidatus Sulfotelmatobacter sp.]